MNKRMVKIAIELKSGAARFKVAAQAQSIEGALEIAKRYNSGKECKVVFPIDPEGFFVEDELGRGGVVLEDSDVSCRYRSGQGSSGGWSAPVLYRKPSGGRTEATALVADIIRG